MPDQKHVCCSCSLIKDAQESIEEIRKLNEKAKELFFLK